MDLNSLTIMSFSVVVEIFFFFASSTKQQLVRQLPTGGFLFPLFMPPNNLIPVFFVIQISASEASDLLLFRVFQTALCFLLS